MVSKINEKYIILGDETYDFYGNFLYRIQAVKDFSDVKAGDKGGWVSGYHNLSQEGNCWVYDEAKVYNNARVYENAVILNNVCISDYSQVYGYAMIFDNAYVCEYANIFDKAKVFEDTFISGSATIYGETEVFDNVHVYDNAEICGVTQVFGEAEISGDVKIERNEDYIVFKNNWSSFRHFTYTKSNKMWRVGCFYGTGDELIKKAYQDSELSGRMYENCVNYVKQQEEIEKDFF